MQFMNDSLHSLDGVWRLRAADESESIPCRIPGDNDSALQATGRISDPYWRRNELAVQWVADPAGTDLAGSRLL